MTNDTDENGKEGGPPRLKIKRKVLRRPTKEARGQSSISFPYQDLESAISVARAIYNAGGVPLSRDQLAGVMNLAVLSGNFVLKLATSRMFGLTTIEGGKYGLSALGFEILDKDENRQKKARADAFMNVPLYKRVYEEFRGRQLPPRPLGLENSFEKFGVAPKQKATARLVFDKSATQAGFFPNGPDRLIEPIIGSVSVAGPKAQPATDYREEDDVAESGQRSRASDNSGLPHFMQMLIEALPEPGTNWTVDGRAKWLQAAATSFDLMYKGDGAISIQAKAAHAESKNDN